jgi:hypothetical protein
MRGLGLPRRRWLVLVLITGYLARRLVRRGKRPVRFDDAELARRLAGLATALGVTLS